MHVLQNQLQGSLTNEECETLLGVLGPLALLTLLEIGMLALVSLAFWWRAVWPCSRALSLGRPRSLSSLLGEEGGIQTIRSQEAFVPLHTGAC